MDNPFVFRISDDNDAFAERKEETEHLKANFINGVNTILVSTRHMGKSSLVDKVCSLVESDEIKIARIDAYNCRSEVELINALATAVIKATSTRWEEWEENAKTFLGHINPEISLGQDPINDFSISVGYDTNNQKSAEVLNLPEVIAEQKGYHMVICIEEFQQIGTSPTSLAFQKRLRSIWLSHTRVSYCLCGSRRRLMEKMFKGKIYPLYQLGEFIYLNKVEEDEWVKYICQEFNATGKQISEDLACEICRVTDRYSTYVQRLSWFVWLQTGTRTVVTAKDLQHGLDSLLDFYEPFFIRQTENLSSYQMNFIRIIVNGAHIGYIHFVKTNASRLGSASNIGRMKKSLMDLDLIAFTKPRYLDMLDPVMTLWLKTRLWKEKE